MFVNIVPDLKIPASHNCNKDFQKAKDPVLNKDFNVWKESQQSDIPTKILMENCEYFAFHFHENINHCFDKSLLFPLDLKLVDVASAYKKNNKSSKDNYRPVSILSNISKVYERCIYLSNSFLL